MFGLTMVGTVFKSNRVYTCLLSAQKSNLVLVKKSQQHAIKYKLKQNYNVLKMMMKEVTWTFTGN